ncbi:TPA: hypothetical protein HH705_004864 [Escherichia coli]|nr:hypothetical protein [Escherichia coli]
MSIKNDGHYFCRAGGNRPDGLNEPVTKKNGYASYDLRRKIEMQHEEFQKMTEREQVPLLKSP